MIILTQELAKLRQEARKNFPNAIWLPGDDPPCGTVVFRDGKKIGTVEGEFIPPADDPDRLRYWWRIKRDDMQLQGKQATSIEYPPTLRPEGEDK